MINKFAYSLFFLSFFGSSIAQSPSIGGYNVYYGTLHNHSAASGATGTPDYAYNYAKNSAGLDFFSLADHAESVVESEWVSIKEAANKYNQDSVFTAFWGFEKSTSGHVAVINSDDYPGISADPAGTFLELCAWVNARNCVAFFNHPGRSTNMLWQGFATTPSDKFVGMELFNGNADYSMHYYNDGFYPNDGNLNHFSEANSRGWRIGAGGSDDNHGGTWGTMTPYRLAILSNYLTREDLFAAMQARRFYSTLDKNLALSFKMGGAEMGSILEGKPYNIQIQARDKDGESFTRVMLFRNGYETKTWVINTPEVNITFPVNTYDKEFYYVKVTQSDGNEAISSPIFIRGGVTNIHPTCSISAPENGIHFDAPQSITITAEASDTDGSVASVEFIVNGNSAGTDTLPPYSINYNAANNGPYSVIAKVRDEAESWTISSPVEFTIGTFSEVRNLRINSAMNDVEEGTNGIMDTTSSDLELVYTGSVRQTVGLRFTGLNIPRGAKIQSANIQFTVDEVSTAICKLYIKGHNADNSEIFTGKTNNISGRLTTSAEVIWEPAAWAVIGAAGADQKTPDLSPVLQEIVDRPGYNSGSAITFIITGTTGKRVAEAYESGAATAALLNVTYSFGTVSSESGPEFDETHVRIYPNPVSNDRVTVEINGGFECGTSITVLDIYGRIFNMSQIEKNETVIDVSGMKSGLYIIRLSNRNKVQFYKLLVE